MIGGEAGVGKTRLTEEALSLAKCSGFKTYRGRCLPGSPYPYMPFRQAFRAPPGSMPARGGPARKYLVTSYDRLEDPTTSPAYSDQSSLRDVIQLSTLEHLRDESHQAPVLLVLEDLQWADSPSLQLLYFLARNIGGSRVVIIGNYRSEDLITVESRTTHPLKDTLHGMEGERVCTMMSLDPLDEQGTIMAVEELLGGRMERSVGSKIYQETGGNPLFALETALLLVKVGSIIDVGGTWKPVDELSMRMPQTMREVILGRLDHVSSEARRVIEVASVMGTEFEPSLIPAIISIDLETLDQELRALEFEHQLIKRGERERSFRHAKLRDIVYDSISGMRRRELHARIGMSLEARGGPDPLPGTLSFHYYNARMWGRCLKYSMLAGDDLLQRFAAAEALPYYQRADIALGSDPSLEPGRARVTEGLADAYQETLDFSRADELYLKVLPLIKDNNGRARVLRKRMWCWDHDRLGNGSLEMQKRLIEEGLAIPDIDPLERAEILSVKSSSVLHGGDAEQAKKISETAIGIFRQVGAKPRLAWELIFCGYIDLSQMHFDEALAKLSEARAILEEHPWSLAENDADQHMGRIMVYRGRSREAIELFIRSLSRSVQLGEYRVAGIACYYLALVHEEEEDLEGTEEWIDKGLKYASQAGYRPQMAMLELLQAHIAVLKKDPRKAEALLEAAEDLYSGVDRSIRNFASGMLLVERGEVLFLKGEINDSDLAFERGLGELMEVPNGTFYEAMARRWYGDILTAAGRMAEASAQYALSANRYEDLSNINWAARLRGL